MVASIVNSSIVDILLSSGHKLLIANILRLSAIANFPSCSGHHQNVVAAAIGIVIAHRAC